jgi:hypothetical protein
MLRAVSQKSRPARVGHRIPSGKLGQSQIQIRTKGFGIAASLSKCVLGRAPAAVARRLACPRCLPLADAEFFGENIRARKPGQKFRNPQVMARGHSRKCAALRGYVYPRQREQSQHE